jgi:tRNA threonylcarbamoyladenosine biosynthesis protein TsaB
MSDRFVLTLDGSTRTCGTALLRIREPVVAAGEDWEVVSRRVEVDGPGQARSLLTGVDGMLLEAGACPSDLGAVVVGTGPGTFTGVRIAVATARALGLSLGIPVLGVSTLSALAAGAVAGGTGAALPEVVVPAVDARRGQVFYAVYESAEADEGGGGRVWRRTLPVGVCDRGELARAVGRMHGAVWIAGEMVDVGEPLPPGWSLSGGEVAPEMLVRGQASLEEPAGEVGGRRLGPWIVQALMTGWDPIVVPVGAPGTAETVKPIYVRAPDADLHIQKMRDPWGEPQVAG